jgi:hypothetical protein
MLNNHIIIKWDDKYEGYCYVSEDVFRLYQFVNQINTVFYFFNYWNLQEFANNMLDFIFSIELLLELFMYFQLLS